MPSLSSSSLFVGCRSQPGDGRAGGVMSESEWAGARGGGACHLSVPPAALRERCPDAPPRSQRCPWVHGEQRRPRRIRAHPRLPTHGGWGAGSRGMTDQQPRIAPGDFDRYAAPAVAICLMKFRGQALNRGRLAGDPSLGGPPRRAASPDPAEEEGPGRTPVTWIAGADPVMTRSNPSA